MQAYCDHRLRRRAEQFRALYNACKDDKLAIDDAYARADGSEAWADARQDGPPHLLQAGNDVSPDDLLNYNGFITAFLGFVETTEAARWAVLQRACVQPVND